MSGSQSSQDRNGDVRVVLDTDGQAKKVYCSSLLKTNELMLCRFKFFNNEVRRGRPKSAQPDKRKNQSKTTRRMSQIDLALDEIIKQNPRSRRGGRGVAASRVRRGSGGVRGSAAAARRGSAGFQMMRVRQAGSFTKPGQIPEGPWVHDRFDTERGGYSLRATRAGLNETAKLLVTNLDYGVSDTDIKELFSEFGPIRRAAVHYDKSARSLGSADVVFERKIDAMRALKQYDNVPLDGRPMKIQMISSEPRAAPLGGGSVFNRVQMGGGRINRGSGVGRRGGARAPRGGRGRGGRRQPPPSQEDLDAELDAYVNKMDSS